MVGIHHDVRHVVGRADLVDPDHVAAGVQLSQRLSLALEATPQLGGPSHLHAQELDDHLLAGLAARQVNGAHPALADHALDEAAREDRPDSLVPHAVEHLGTLHSWSAALRRSLALRSFSR